MACRGGGCGCRGEWPHLLEWCRYRQAGEEGLFDCSSAPLVVANRTEERRVEVIAALRRLR